jgi:hypothetical protein
MSVDTANHVITDIGADFADQKDSPGGFTYKKEDNYWECSQGKRAQFRKTFEDKGVKKNQYATRRADCPIKTACIGKSS